MKAIVVTLVQMTVREYLFWKKQMEKKGVLILNLHKILFNAIINKFTKIICLKFLNYFFLSKNKLYIQFFIN